MPLVAMLDGERVDATKHEVKDHSTAALTRQLAESRGLLGGHLRLYQIHSVTPESGVLENQEVLDELAQLKESGLKIGLSSSGPTQAETIRKAMGITANGRRLFDCVQATWNPLERSAEPALREAHKAGMGVIVKEALANGRLTTTPQRMASLKLAAPTGASMNSCTSTLLSACAPPLSTLSSGIGSTCASAPPTYR